MRADNSLLACTFTVWFPWYNSVLSVQMVKQIYYFHNPFLFLLLTGPACPRGPFLAFPDYIPPQFYSLIIFFLVYFLFMSLIFTSFIRFILYEWLYPSILFSLFAHYFLSFPYYSNSVSLSLSLSLSLGLSVCLYVSVCLSFLFRSIFFSSFFTLLVFSPSFFSYYIPTCFLYCSLFLNFLSFSMFVLVPITFFFI